MLELRAVSFGYEETQAVDGITASFDRTQLIALTGPNGSGKSTLLKLIARVLAPHAGEIAFDGKRLRDWPAKEYAKQVAYLPQDPDPAFSMRAIDVVVSGRAPFLGRFFHLMLGEGVYLPPSQLEAAFFSAAHAKKDIVQLVERVDRVLKKIAWEFEK